jgi:uncharacterized membrane protein YccC
MSNLSKWLDDKRVAYALLVGGIVLVLLAIIIDPLRGYDVYLALPQIIAIIVGVVAALAGAYLVWIRKPPPVA